jgi:hypothetical protein
MSITQDEADKIVQNIKEELYSNFGDIEHINFLEAILIWRYCKVKSDQYNEKETPVQYAYWVYLQNAYSKAVKTVVNKK